jgi:hypothetical protein
MICKPQAMMLEPVVQPVVVQPLAVQPLAVELHMEVPVSLLLDMAPLQFFPSHIPTAST